MVDMNLSRPHTNLMPQLSTLSGSARAPSSPGFSGALRRRPMQRIGFGVLIFCAFTSVLLAFPQQQQHATIAPGANETTARDLHSQLAGQSRILVIDVRTPEEYAKGHISEAINIPIDELPGKLKHLHVSKETPIVTVCD